MMKKRKSKRAFWGFQLTRALRHPIKSAVHPWHPSPPDPLPRQTESADHEGVHPKTGLGER